ncbi:MAG: hypothetical protein JO029_11405 [Candidatus Eremiobacteraeota bacterium]|nr:hypothetical protein [Candidatus Eremiobacteraeota bacterium]
MARTRLSLARTALFTPVAVFTVFTAYARCDAQNLPRLTVQSLELSTDNPRPELEVPFHLIVRAHVRERVTSIDTILLPILAELELRGDSRTLQQGPNGTDYREIISVVAHHTGEIRIAPVTLQAIDPRDGRAKQYFSNSLTLAVGGGALQPLGNFRSAIGAFADSFARGAFAIGSIACAVALFALIFMRRPAPVPAPPMPAPPTVKPQRTRRDELSDALTVLRAERSRAAAVRVRDAVWGSMGASEGGTLQDVLSRPGAEEPGMNALLHALERAAFTYDADLPAAIEDACKILERYLA